MTSVADHVVEEAQHVDASGTSAKGELISLREVPVQVIEEYAQHAGHADLLRERRDRRWRSRRPLTPIRTLLHQSGTTQPTDDACAHSGDRRAETGRLASRCVINLDLIEAHTAAVISSLIWAVHDVTDEEYLSAIGSVVDALSLAVSTTHPSLPSAT
jgi:hypothetical protein